MHSACALRVQVDPSALLLDHAACWWAAEARGEGAEHGAEHSGGAPRPPPLWINDGPVPTAGLLRYKAQYQKRWPADKTRYTYAAQSRIMAC